MEMPGAPRALREQGRRSFGAFLAGCLKCESDVRARALWRNEPEARHARYFSSTKIWMSNLSSGVVTGSVWYSSMKVPDGSSCFSSRYSGMAL